MTETVTIRLEGDETSDELTVPVALVDLLRENDEPASEVVGDIAMLGFAQQIHGVVHHGHGESSDELEALEAATLERFEQRFGQTFGEMTGHSH